MKGSVIESLYASDVAMNGHAQQDLPFKKFQTLYETFGGVAYEWHHPADHFEWSTQCLKMFGLTQDQMGRDFQAWLKNVHPQDRAEVVRSRNELLQTGRADFVEYRVRHSGGYFLWVRDYNYISNHSDRDTRHVLGYLQNRTELKLRQEELELARRAIDSSINAIAFTDLAGHLTYVNRSFVRMVGYDHPETIVGQQVGVFWKNPKKARVVLRHLQQSGEWSGEVQAHRLDGRWTCFDLSAHVVEDLAGEPLCYMASFVDVEAVGKPKNVLECGKFHEMQEGFSHASFQTLRLQANRHVAGRFRATDSARDL